MLSYRHGFHAGNHADVLKHLTLLAVLEQLQRKQKPYYYLDTHAGAALYALDSAWAQQTQEAKRGILPLWDQAQQGQKLPPLVQTYIQHLQVLNPGSTSLHAYPGSPYLAAMHSREQDTLVALELHSQEIDQLKMNLCQAPHKVQVHHRDALEGLVALMPPVPRRGCVLIDPAYEVKSEYQSLLPKVQKALALWPQGCFMLWMPILASQAHLQLIKGARKLSGAHSGILCYELELPDIEQGMYASALVLINPPWGLEALLDPALDAYQQALEHAHMRAHWKKVWLQQPSAA
ncbi:23S rRNA (adenine2030-N6)-methyltransferase [Allopseudospirillum japonicum]|uniref:Ribosomal RNA large subunit methyltransferase J n=1 Tax=Allopseudospirillum japonicum TaxID=64971 RepID=A0A1H6TTS7_9GAMM|nr:23S rRNA (adenine(2030)-N(6))-methyltransferase RlmJ [Allopseudospirillum japonicum]SEI79132.1 23S rRNA (adenine2030-N6)-methyltransferase [Allopseudospirillum japonicum]